MTFSTAIPLGIRAYGVCGALQGHTLCHLRVRCVYIAVAGRSHAGQLQGNYRWKEEMKGFFVGAKRAKIGQEKPLL